MSLKIQERQFPTLNTATPARPNAPVRPEVARAEGAEKCAPTTEMDQAIFDIQVGNPRGQVFNDVYKIPSNDGLQATRDAIRARRESFVTAERPYESAIDLDLGNEAFSWKAAVAGVELSDLAYRPEAEIKKQAGKWGFDDVSFIEKRTPLRKIKDIFRARDVQAFVAGNKDSIVVSVRGTESHNIRDLLTDLAALFPSDMKTKAFPKGLTGPAAKEFDDKLLAAMQKRIGPGFVDLVANQNSRMTPEQLSTVIKALPAATAEALGNDPSATKTIEDAIHRGFKEAKDLVSPEILSKVLRMWEDDLINQKPMRPVYLFGHSMGGAVATLMSYDLMSMTQQLGTLAKAAGLTNLSELVKPGFKFPLGGVYTYEAPRSFKSRVVDEVRQVDLGGDSPDKLIHNIVRLGDPIPNVPSWGSWTNMGNMVYLDATVGRLRDCPDPRANAMINPSQDELKAAIKARSDWFDSTAPADFFTHRLGELRDVVKEQAALAAKRPLAARPVDPKGPIAVGN